MARLLLLVEWLAITRFYQQTRLFEPFYWGIGQTTVI